MLGVVVVVKLLGVVVVVVVELLGVVVAVELLGVVVEECPGDVVAELAIVVNSGNFKCICEQNDLHIEGLFIQFHMRRSSVNKRST